MRLDVALALALVAGGVGVSLAAAPLGAAAVFVLLLVLVLAARGVAGPRLESRSRDRLDAALVVGLAVFALLVADRVRQALSL